MYNIWQTISLIESEIDPGEWGDLDDWIDIGLDDWSAEDIVNEWWEVDLTIE